MRRMLLVLMLALVMVAMVVATSVPAFAARPNCWFSETTQNCQLSPQACHAVTNKPDHCHP